MSESLYCEAGAINICIREVIKELRQEPDRVRIKITDVEYKAHDKIWVIEGIVIIKSIMGIDCVARKKFKCAIDDTAGSVIKIEYS